MTDIEMLPLPGSLSHWLKMRASDSEESAVMHVAVHHHARAVAEHNAEKLRRECDAAVYALANTERSLAAARKARDLFADRTERLAEALRELVELKDNVKHTFPNDYEARKPLAWEAARAALRDHDQEASECPDCLNDGCACSKCNPHPGDQQPAAVDEAMADRAVAGYAAGPWAAFSPEASHESRRDRMRSALTAALAGQQGSRSGE